MNTTLKCTKKKFEVKKQLIGLLNEKEKADHKIHEIIWEYLGNDKKETPNCFPYKKLMREEFGIVV